VNDDDDIGNGSKGNDDDESGKGDVNDDDDSATRARAGRCLVPRARVA